MTNKERYAALGYFFLENGTRDIIPVQEVAQKIYDLKDPERAQEAGVNRSELHNWVSKARKYVEANAGTTIYCVPGKGYRAARPKDYALFTAQWMKRTFQAAQRTEQLMPRVNPKYMPGAMRKVFNSAGKHLTMFSSQTVKMIPVLQEITNKRKEEENAKH